LENKQVMKRFEDRREAIKNEVKDVRGLPWRPREEECNDEWYGSGRAHER
jgi:hypothetical protein